MKLTKARVQNYRSIRDTGEFDIEELKTIMVGPNEAGKSAILQAMQQINRPEGVSGFDSLRDYPRKLLNRMDQGELEPKDVEVATVWFDISDELVDLPPSLQDGGLKYERTVYLDNHSTHSIVGAAAQPKFSDVEADLLRLAKHLDQQTTHEEGEEPPSAKLKTLVSGWQAYFSITAERAQNLEAWLQDAIPLVEEGNEAEEQRLSKLRASMRGPIEKAQALSLLNDRVPKLVLFSNYFRVRPIIHLAKLAQRIATGALEDETYDYGNLCLLKLLGLEADELSKLGKAGFNAQGQLLELDTFRDELDKRDYRLNSASIMLTDSIREVWNPNPNRAEADRLRIKADGQYLKVVVEDELGVEVELDQRSEGFQWLVSFFVVFFAEARDKHENAILLLDEPGLHLHGLKQRDFRETLSKLSAKNQTLFTTHSPFLVGPEELDLVRVVEMTDRDVGTKVLTTITSSDPAGLLPLQEALGYDLAQSLFTQKKNLILEGLTDYWYMETMSEMLRDAGKAELDKKIALVPANSASKVVYFATILHAQGLKVAALLDSDTAGEQVAQQDTLVHTVGNKNILRTKDFLNKSITSAEVEDMLRETLVVVAKSELGWDVAKVAAKQTSRPLVSIMEGEIKDFSKYRLAKAFLRWSKTHGITDLSADEVDQWKSLITATNKALK
jgi:predicted ATPase